MHYLVLFLLNLCIRVVRREDEVDFPTKRVDANHPVVRGVHLLLQAVWVVQELLVQLVQNQLKFNCQDVFGNKVAELHSQVHT